MTGLTHQQKIKNATSENFKNIKNGPKNLKNVSPENLGKNKELPALENPNVLYRTILRVYFDPEVFILQLCILLKLKDKNSFVFSRDMTVHHLIVFWMKMFCQICGEWFIGVHNFSPGLFCQLCKVLHRHSDPKFRISFKNC